MQGISPQGSPLDKPTATQQPSSLMQPSNWTCSATQFPWRNGGENLRMAKEVVGEQKPVAILTGDGRLAIAWSLHHAATSQAMAGACCPAYHCVEGLRGMAITEELRSITFLSGCIVPLETGRLIHSGLNTYLMNVCYVQSRGLEN